MYYGSGTVDRSASGHMHWADTACALFTHQMATLLREMRHGTILKVQHQNEN